MRREVKESLLQRIVQTGCPPTVVLWSGRSPVDLVLDLVQHKGGRIRQSSLGRLANANDQVRVFVSRARPTEQVMSEILPGRVKSDCIKRILSQLLLRGFVGHEVASRETCPRVY
jgi:hypothetical protein